MSTVVPIPRQVAIKVSPEGEKLITSAPHCLRMSKKDLVEAAIESCLNARREEMQAGMRELLSQQDGSTSGKRHRAPSPHSTRSAGRRCLRALATPRSDGPARSPTRTSRPC